MKQCAVDGCSKEARFSKNHYHRYCSVHENRFYKYGTLDELPRETIEQYLEKYINKTESCWLWTGHKASNGYGVVSFGSKRFRAHRKVYEIKFGPIPDNLLACHTCDNRICVNPDHIFIGDYQANNDDMSQKGRHWQQQKTHCPKGHELVAGNLVLNLLKKTGRRKCLLCTKEQANKYARKIARQKADEHATHK